MEDLYKILGVDEGASNEDIKKRYRELAKKLHPDKGGNEEEFKKVSGAYDILSDENKRKEYDAQKRMGGHEFNFGHFSHFGENHGMDDFFNKFFNSRKTQSFSRGEDIRITISVTLKEVLTGIDKKIKYNRQFNCSTCSGTGAKDSNSFKVCGTCSGSGYIFEVQQTMFGGMAQTIQICPTCFGSKKTIADKCISCNGDGLVSKEESLDINVPPGVHHNMEFILSEKGNFKKNNGIAGNLIIRVIQKDDEQFTRVQNDIHSDVFISISDAILGNSELKIPTLESSVKINSDAGIESGHVYRLQGQGLPDFNNPHQRGDLYAHLSIYIPTNLNDEDKKIIQKIFTNKDYIPNNDKTKLLKGSLKKIKSFAKLFH